jgi:hypothetical protein
MSVVVLGSYSIRKCCSRWQVLKLKLKQMRDCYKVGFYFTSAIVFLLCNACSFHADENSCLHHHHVASTLTQALVQICFPHGCTWHNHEACSVALLPVESLHTDLQA